METPPLLSVVIPTFNRRELLDETLLSLSIGASDRIEIIVVDDGSSDGTMEMLEERSKEWPVLRFEQQKNAGPGAARNRGVAMARAEWIAFLDSDDLWLPWTPAEILRVISENSSGNSTSAMFLQTQDFSDPDELASWGRTSAATESFATMYDMRLTPPLAMQGACNFVIRKDVFTRLGGFLPSLTCGEDTDLFFRAGDVGAICCITAPVLVGYRVSNQDSLTRREVDLKRAASNLLRQYRRGAYPGPAEKRDYALHKSICHAIRGFFARGQAVLAYELYLESLGLFWEKRDFHNILRFPLTPIMSLVHPNNYKFRWRAGK